MDTKTDMKKACIFGGTGFIGRHVVQGLAKAGFTVVVATRMPEQAYFLKPLAAPGQIVPLACDVRDDNAIAAALKGCDIVINCIGILAEKGKSARFDALHAKLPARIGRAACAAGVSRLVHISAMGVETSSSRYAASKRDGEKGLRTAFPDAVILRPSVVFGDGDKFFNMFASLSRLLPAFPLIGGGKTRFQPVFGGDVAQAVLNAAIGQKDVAGKIYELGGPDILTFREIYEKLFQHTGRPRALVPVPWGIAAIQGTVMGVMPNPLLTRDQVESLKTDTVVPPGALTLSDLGIAPTAMDSILAGYLSRHRPGGRFADRKSA